MIKLIISVLLLVATIATLVITLKQEDEYDNITFQWNKKGLLSIIPLGLLVFVQSICVIPSNTVGVKYSALPFVDKIYKIDTTVQERTDDNVSVQTKDAQWARMQVNVKYEVSKSNAFKVYKQYKTMDALKDNIIGNYAQNATIILLIYWETNEMKSSTKQLIS